MTREHVGLRQLGRAELLSLQVVLVLVVVPRGWREDAARVERGEKARASTAAARAPARGRTASPSPAAEGLRQPYGLARTVPFVGIEDTQAPKRRGPQMPALPARPVSRPFSDAPKAPPYAAGKLAERPKGAQPRYVMFVT